MLSGSTPVSGTGGGAQAHVESLVWEAGAEGDSLQGQPTDRPLEKLMRQNGFCLLDAEDLIGRLGRQGLEQWSAELLKSALPIDPYTAGDRGRMYTNLLLDPLGRRLVKVNERSLLGRSTTPYFQAYNVNPDDEAHGLVRDFDSLPDHLSEDLNLHALIHALHELSMSSDILPKGLCLIGVHITELRARPGHPGRSCPDLVHCDGEPVTAGFLLRRENVIGGVNIITKMSCRNLQREAVESHEVLAQFTLRRAFEGYIVDDLLVAHDVSPVESADGITAGRRTILLIDFRPLKPQLTEDLLLWRRKLGMNVIGVLTGLGDV